MKKPCPKCKSENTYSDGLEMDCLMCGKRWPINGHQPINVIGVKKVMDSKKKSPSGKTGICLNCERGKFIAGADGLCGTCHHAVQGLAPDTPDYISALDRAKARLTKQKDSKSEPSPNRKKIKQKYPSPLKNKHLKKKHNIEKQSIVSREQKTPAIQAAIEHLTKEVDYYLARADKLNKAIEILQS